MSLTTKIGDLTIFVFLDLLDPYHLSLPAFLVSIRLVSYPLTLFTYFLPDNLLLLSFPVLTLKSTPRIAISCGSLFINNSFSSFQFPHLFSLTYLSAIVNHLLSIMILIAMSSCFTIDASSISENIPFLIVSIIPRCGLLYNINVYTFFGCFGPRSMSCIVSCILLSDTSLMHHIFGPVTDGFANLHFCMAFWKR